MVSVAVRLACLLGAAALWFASLTSLAGAQAQADTELEDPKRPVTLAFYGLPPGRGNPFAGNV